MRVVEEQLEAELAREDRRAWLRQRGRVPLVEDDDVQPAQALAPAASLIVGRG